MFDILLVEALKVPVWQNPPAGRDDFESTCGVLSLTLNVAINQAV